MHSQKKQIFTLTVFSEVTACQNASWLQFSITTVSYFSIPNEHNTQVGNSIALYFRGTRFKCSQGECIFWLDFIHSFDQRLKMYHNCFLPQPLPFSISSFKAAETEMLAALFNRLSMHISHIQIYTVIYSFRHLNFHILLAVYTKIYFSTAVLFNQRWAELGKVAPSSCLTILSPSRLLLGHYLNPLVPELNAQCDGQQQTGI